MKPTDMIEPLLTYDELSTVVQVSARTIRRLIATGELEAIRINARVVRVSISAWHRFCERKATVAATRHARATKAASPRGRTTAAGPRWRRKENTNPTQR